jgi:hypothetical protein
MLIEVHEGRTRRAMADIGSVQGNGQVGTRLHDLVQSRALGKHSRQQQHFFIALFLFFSVPALHCYIILFYQHIYYNLINISPLHCSKLHFY